MNDPNALIYEGGRYRLYVQHCPQPSFGPMGWGYLTSDDLLNWQWAGVAFAPTATHSVFSGSMTRGPDGALDLYYTLHDRTSRHETQHRNGGVAMLDPSPPIGPHGQDCRDPFVLFSPATNDWRMLVAHPCDIVDWAEKPPSRLSVWASSDRATWSETGRIGPWHPPGIMWEVPTLIDFGTTQVLILSLVDVSNGGRACSVRYWVGQFDGTNFVRSPDCPDNGVLLDHGPDFYAAIPNVVSAWPDAERAVVAWAASWDTAAMMPLPGDVHGGPITLPRIITLQGNRLHQQPIGAALARQTASFSWTPESSLRLTAKGERTALTISISAGGEVIASRVGEIPFLAWQNSDPVLLSKPTDIIAFVDAGLVELFFIADGLTLTAFVPGAAHIAA